jgi:hypothetical protein
MTTRADGVNEQVTLRAWIQCGVCARKLDMSEVPHPESVRTGNTTESAAYWLESMAGGILTAAGARRWEHTEKGWRCAHCVAVEHGPDPDLRIALCGYEGEHEMPGWTKHAWKAARGYAGESNENRQLERIWFSPHCLPIADAQASLFGSDSMIGGSK